VSSTRERETPVPPPLADFLGRSTRAFLITLRRDGSPTIHPMTGLFAGDRLAFNTYRKSAKARNVERDARAAAVVVNGYGAPRVEAVVLKGSARFDAATEFRAAGVQAAEAAPRVSGSISGRVTDRIQTGKRVIIALEPDEVRFLGDHPSPSAPDAGAGGSSSTGGSRM